MAKKKDNRLSAPKARTLVRELRNQGKDDAEIRGILIKDYQKSNRGPITAEWLRAEVFPPEQADEAQGITAKDSKAIALYSKTVDSNDITTDSMSEDSKPIATTSSHENSTPIATDINQPDTSIQIAIRQG